MTELEIGTLLADVLKTAITIALPILGTGLIVGLIISILQTTTSIQEITLTFVPKILAILTALIIFGGWIGTHIIEFTISHWSKLSQI